MMRYAILNGLCSEIATYVTQQNPTNIDQLLAAARVAELTMSSQPTHDSALHAKVDRLVDSWEKMSVNPIRDNRSPTPTRKQVTFTPADRQSPTSQAEAVRWMPLCVHRCDVASIVDVYRVAQDPSELCGFNQICFEFWLYTVILAGFFWGGGIFILHQMSRANYGPRPGILMGVV